MKHKKNSIFRRTVTTVAALSMLLSCVPFVGDTWAWFTDSNSASVGAIQSATLDVEFSIKETEGAKVSLTEEKGVYTADLEKGEAYTITLNTDNSTVTSAYCEIYSDGLNAVTNNIIRNGDDPYTFTIDLQEYAEPSTPSASDEQGDLPTIPPETDTPSGEEAGSSGSESNGGSEENLDVVPKDESEASVPGTNEEQTTIDDPAVPLNNTPVDASEEQTAGIIEFRFIPHWGSYPIDDASAVGFGMDVGFGFGPLIIEDGAVVNEWGEPIDPNMVLVTQPTETESSAPAYVAASEHDIPLYYQNDYPNNRYGAGSIASDGCGVISLAMIANYMTGYTYDPVDLARWFGGRAENNIQRMEIGATTLGLPWVKAENINEATTALYDGKIVIMMMDGFHFDNPFTTSQHFIVVRGITEDGRYLVNDSNKLNYDKWELKEGFEKGFSRTVLTQGYSGAWIFDPEAFPADHQPYIKEEYPRQDNYPGVELTYEEQELLAKLIWAEARGECAEGQQAVAEVVLNRLVSGKFQQSITGVILGPGQFRGVEKMDEAEPWQAQYDAIDAARYGKPVLEKDVYYFATTPFTSQVFATIGGHVFCRDEIDSEGNVPAVTVPEATVPEMTAPETTIPETTVPETTVPETTVPEVTVPATTVPEVTAPEITEPANEDPEKPKLGDEDYEGPGHNILNYYQTAENTEEQKFDSSVVSLAMVATYMTGYDYTPEVLAGWFGEAEEDEVSRLKTIADTLKLPWVEAESIQQAAEAAGQEKILILRLENDQENPCEFTSDVHFLVIRGVTEDGKYLVNDPDGTNYEKEELLAGFEHGFSLDDFRSAYTHCWIFDPQGLSEDFVPYTQ